jgi:hypothetical protein
MRPCFAAVLTAGVWCALVPGPNVSAAGLEPAAWNANDNWTLSVERFARSGAEETDTVEARYTIRVLVLSRERYNGSVCWHLNFIIPHTETRPSGKDHLGLFVDRQNGWPRRLLGAEAPVKLLGSGDVAFVRGAPRDFPAELFPVAKYDHLVLGGSPAASLSIDSRAAPDGTVVEALLESDGKPEVRIRQVWAPGAKWWRSYERFVDGRKDLRARLVEGGLPADALAAAPSSAEPDDLSGDPALRPLLSGQWQDAPLNRVLQALAERTGLHFEVEPALAEQAPVVGALQLSNVPVWRAMEQLAAHNVVDGRWVRIADGYRLHGSRPVSREQLRPAPHASRSSWSIPRLLLGLFVPGVLVLLVWAHRRRQALRPLAAPSPGSPTSHTS